MIPRLAVVGHPNKGKSSIVATLSEDGDVAISEIPGTTVSSRVFPMTVDGEVLYELIDTPGFQRPRQVLGWLERHCDSAEERAGTVARFVEEHRNESRFHDECELLTPLVEGAGILYVVDGSRPYGREYEAEMEVLRWTGRPRMALINLIGEDDYVEQWRRALDQFFAIVRVFDAVRADAEKRFALLRTFGELSDEWRGSLERAVAVLESDRRGRTRRSASEVAHMLVEALTAQRTVRIGENEQAAPVIERLEKELRERLVKREHRARQEIEAIYRHARIERHEEAFSTLDLDLFSEQTEELFGLSRAQLVATGAVGGAVAGSGIDLAAGGSSLLLAAGIGALLGGASAFVGQDRLGKLKLLGQSLVSRNLTVGPVQDPGLPWTLLGRAMLHHRLVCEHNHARRESLSLEAERGRHLAETIASDVRRQLQGCFTRIRKDANEEQIGKLTDLLETLFAHAERGGGGAPGRGPGQGAAPAGARDPGA